jgi:hypothetical protein
VLEKGPADDAERAGNEGYVAHGRVLTAGNLRPEESGPAALCQSITVHPVCSGFSKASNGLFPWTFPNWSRCGKHLWPRGLAPRGFGSRGSAGAEGCPTGRTGGSDPMDQTCGSDPWARPGGSDPVGGRPAPARGDFCPWIPVLPRPASPIRKPCGFHPGPGPRPAEIIRPHRTGADRLQLTKSSSPALPSRRAGGPSRASRLFLAPVQSVSPPSAAPGSAADGRRAPR